MKGKDEVRTWREGENEEERMKCVWRGGEGGAGR